MNFSLTCQQRLIIEATRALVETELFPREVKSSEQAFCGAC